MKPFSLGFAPPPAYKRAGNLQTVPTRAPDQKDLETAMRHGFWRAAGLALTVTGALGVAACGGSKGKQPKLAPPRLTTIGVNAYLWRAALETVGFMPLLQTDANTGVILSDWYVNPQVPGERVKVTVLILDQELRADAIKVSAVRQEARNGQWLDAAVQAGTVQKLEEAIMTRARQLRQGAGR
jgi:hypothetical protein